MTQRYIAFENGRTAKSSALGAFSGFIGRGTAATTAATGGRFQVRSRPLANKRRPARKPAGMRKPPRRGATKGRGSAAKERSKTMSGYTRFFAAKRKQGLSAKAIGRAWRSQKGGGGAKRAPRRKAGRKSARRNKKGIPLTGSHFRPKLPTSGGVVVVQQAAGESFKKARARRSYIKGAQTRRKKRRAAKASGKKRRKGGRKKASKNTAVRTRARRRYGKHRRRASRNFGGGFLGTLKSIVMRPLTKDTLKLAGGVLAGAIVATGAPSLLPSWNVGWMGLGLSVLAAGGAAALAQRFAPASAGAVAAGGIVVVGLRLIGQFFPTALRWSASPVVAGFSRPGGGLALGGFQRPGGGNVLAGLGASARTLTGGGNRGLVSAGREVFRARRFA